MRLAMTRSRTKEKSRLPRVETVTGKIVQINTKNRTLTVQGGWTENYRMVTLTVLAKSTDIKKNGAAGVFKELKINERVSARYVDKDSVKKALVISVAR